MKKTFDFKGSIILGMHDAIVSLTGLIAGLYFALATTKIIVLSCIISSITASLSMGAANYLAVKTENKKYALRAALLTGFSYMATCVLLILPFFIFYMQSIAILFVFIITIFIIYLFNAIFYEGEQFYKHFFEMLTICTCVSFIAFLIGNFIKF